MPNIVSKLVVTIEGEFNADLLLALINNFKGVECTPNVSMNVERWEDESVELTECMSTIQAAQSKIDEGQYKGKTFQDFIDDNPFLTQEELDEFEGIYFEPANVREYGIQAPSHQLYHYPVDIQDANTYSEV